MARKRAFGVSTHLYHDYRLSREHLLEVAAHGFERIEMFATRTHFDYQNPAAVADLQQWLADAGLELHGVHAPIGESFEGGRWGPPINMASPDPAARARAMDETERALQIARRIPFGVLVTHIGLPRSQPAAATENSRDAARRSLEELQRLAAPLGVMIALEVIPNELSRAGSLVHFVEDGPGRPRRRHLPRFRPRAHGRRSGRRDRDRLGAPGHDARARQSRPDRRSSACRSRERSTGRRALTAIQKVGYDGTLLLEIAAHGSAKDTLQRAARRASAWNGCSRIESQVRLEANSPLAGEQSA